MNFKNIFFFLMVLLVMAGCAGGPKVSDQQLSTAYGDVSPEDAFKQAEQSFSKASQEKLGDYSPQQFKHAKDSLKEARNLFKKSPHDRDILKYTYIFEQHLKKAKRIRTYVTDKLANLLNAKTTLVGINVMASFNKDYNNVLGDIKKLIADIEETQSSNKIDKGDVADNSEKRDEILKVMVALEIKVVKFNTLSNNIKKLAEAENNDAHKFAKKTFSEANVQLAKAQDFIQNNVKDSRGIKAVGEAFRFAVDHVIQVASAVKNLQKLKKDHYEDYILNSEKNLLQVSEALEHKDARDKPTAEQVKLLVSKASSLLNSNRLSKKFSDKNTKSQIALQENLKTTKEDAQRLKAEFEQRVSVLQAENKKLEAKYATLKLRIGRVAAKSNIPKKQKVKLLGSAEMAPKQAPTKKADSVTPVTSKTESMAQQILAQPQPVDLKKALESEPEPSHTDVETAAVGVKAEEANTTRGPIVSQ